MDDTTEYVYNGVRHKWEKTPVYILSKKSNADKGVRSQYISVESNAQMNRQCMKHTFMMTGAGQQGPIFITITGLSAAELCPDEHPSRHLVVLMEGLSIGSAINLGDKQIGYICFI